MCAVLLGSSRSEMMWTLRSHRSSGESARTRGRPPRRLVRPSSSRAEIDGIGQSRVEQLDRVLAGGRREIIRRLVLDILRRRLDEERSRILAVLRAPTVIPTSRDELTEFEETAQREAEQDDRLKVVTPVVTSTGPIKEKPPRPGRGSRGHRW
jgi:hypothetical protein